MYLCIYLSERKRWAHWNSFSSEGFSSKLRKLSALIYSINLRLVIHRWEKNVVFASKSVLKFAGILRIDPGLQRYLGYCEVLGLLLLYDDVAR